MSRWKFLIFLAINFVLVIAALLYLHGEAFGMEMNQRSRPVAESMAELYAERMDELCVLPYSKDAWGIVIFFPCYIANDPIKKQEWERICYEDFDLNCYGFML